MATSMPDRLMALPSSIRRYLFISLATISSPPEEALQLNSMDSPTPTTNKAVLGITVQTLDPQTAYQYGMMPGVYVSDITVQSTKDAGLQVGDRIVSVDDVAVAQATDVTGYLANKNVGDTVNLTVARETKMLTLTIPLVANSDQ